MLKPLWGLSLQYNSNKIRVDVLPIKWAVDIYTIVIMTSSRKVHILIVNYFKLVMNIMILKHN